MSATICETQEASGSEIVKMFRDRCSVKGSLLIPEQKRILEKLTVFDYGEIKKGTEKGPPKTRARFVARGFINEVTGEWYVPKDEFIVSYHPEADQPEVRSTKLNLNGYCHAAGKPGMHFMCRFADGVAFDGPVTTKNERAEVVSVLEALQDLLKNADDAAKNE